MYGGVSFFFKEIGAASFSATYAFVVSYALMWIMSQFMEVVIQDPAMLKNVDRWEFSEVAYAGAQGSSVLESQIGGITDRLMADKKPSSEHLDVEMGQRK